MDVPYAEDISVVTLNRAAAGIAAGVALLSAAAAGVGVLARDTTYVAVTSARGLTYEVDAVGA
jgi:hypothetical protein